MLWQSLAHPLPNDFPNGLAAPHPDRRKLSGRAWILAVLVLLCWLPRLHVAGQLYSICPDGVYYVELAKQIEDGGWTSVCRQFQVNTYPVILAGLHQLGLEWQQAGMLWGLIVSSLVVLPMFGLLRRMFDDRVALVACLLYALHPTVARWSPEMLRDSTFWLLMQLAMYLLWRAVIEVRVGMLVLATLTIGAAAVTRFEGAFLLLPLIAWPVQRYRPLQSNRGRLLAGALLCWLAIPLALALVKLFLLRDPGHTIYRLTPLELAHGWFKSLLFGSTADAATSPISSLPPGASFRSMVYEFVPLLVRGFSPAFGLLTLFGAMRWRHVVMRRDHLPLVLVATAILAGMWISLWSVHESNPRYVISVAIASAALPALAVIEISGWCVRLAAWSSRRLWPKVVASAAPLTLAVALSLVTLLSYKFHSRMTEVRLGHWLRDQAATPLLVGPAGLVAVVNYHAGAGHYRSFPWDTSPDDIWKLAEETRPDIVVLRPTKQLTLDRYLWLVARLNTLGLDVVSRDRLPPGCDAVSVLARQQMCGNDATRR
jgi:4-amino-4-deoxy-L-arabinose transferase-like glycosyltransferase